MAEQAQDDADDRDVLQETPLGATAPPPQNPLANLLIDSDTPTPPPQDPPQPAGQSAPQLKAKRAQLLQNLLNAILIASADQIARMLQVFEPQRAQPGASGRAAPPPAPPPQNQTSPLAPRTPPSA